MLEMNLDWWYGDYYLTYEEGEAGLKNNTALRDYNFFIFEAIETGDVQITLGEKSQHILDDIKNAPFEEKLLYFYSDGRDIPYYDKVKKDDKYLYLLQNVNCENCIKCYGCINCKVCEDCIKCISCISSNKCEQCTSCIACSECDECIKCTSCYNCSDCNNCIRCQCLENCDDTIN